MRLGKRIQELREEKKWSQMYLAIETGSAQGSVYSWEAGRSLPSLPAFVELCKAFELTAEEFLKGVELR